MRLVSCVGLLMVIPAVALLTHSNGYQLNKLETAETHQKNKTRSITPQQTARLDSVPFSKAGNEPAQTLPILIRNR